MIRNLFRLGVLAWMASVAYRQLSSVNPAQIKKHMEVVGSDGAHVGTVDHLAVKLTKSDPDAAGVHHILPLDSVASIADGKLTLHFSAAEARQKQQAIAAREGVGSIGRSPGMAS